MSRRKELNGSMKTPVIKVRVKAIFNGSLKKLKNVNPKFIFMKSKELKKKIDSHNSQITDLQNRHADISNQLSQLKEKSSLDNPADLKKMQNLKSEKDLLSELISDHEKDIERLSERLQVQVVIDDREKTVQDLAELAEQAKKLENTYREKLKTLDNLLTQAIPELAEIRTEWREVAGKFMSTGDSLGRGLKLSTNLTLARNGEDYKISAGKFLDELQEKGIDTASARSRDVLSSSHFTNLVDSDPLPLNFGENLFRMLQQRNLDELKVPKKVG